jgi:quercetin dioxygenase-like cupin family protein
MAKNIRWLRAGRLPALVICAGLGAACASQAGEAPFDPKANMVLPAARVDYQNINPAIQMGDAYGDRAKGAHGTFGKFPPDFITPFHTHSGAYHGVVVAGVMTNPFAGEQNPPEMVPGSYWYVPAQAVHATACVSDTPCQFYFHADDAFDFTPVE